MKKHAALEALLSHVEDPKERERLTAAFHSLSQGDEKSFPVVFALVANGAAQSIAESAAAVMASADKICCSNEGRPLPFNRPTPQSNKSWPILVMGMALSGCIAAAAVFFPLRAHFEKQLQNHANQSNQIQELLSDLQQYGGGIRYYSAADQSGRAVRHLIVDGGAAPPQDVFLNASGQATIVLPHPNTP